MNSVIEYIMANYTWIIVCSILILLAIIGGYAEKTNFGQGKNNNLEEDSDEKNNDSNGIVIQDNPVLDNKVNQVTDTPQQNQVVPGDTVIYQPMQNQQIELNQTNLNDNNLINNQNVGVINSQPVENYNEFNDGFNKFEEEFNSILPKKDIIDDGLLEDINNLSLDKTQKLDLIIPDLDDVELPRIGSIETEQKQIWKK